MTIKKILLVDDSKTELHHLSDLLAKRGYRRAHRRERRRGDAPPRPRTSPT